MQSRNITLLALDAFGGKISGRTLFIKRLFFLGELLGKELGYYAHYYGPYSDEIASNITLLKNAGLIREESMGFGMVNGAGFEVRRFDYELTEEGRKAVNWLQEQDPQEAMRIREAAKRIQEAGEVDYVDLSIAAKAYMILRKTNRPMIPQDIALEARKFSWRVDDPQVQRGIEFLKKLKLVSEAPSKN